jgi:hypothetical protein
MTTENTLDCCPKFDPLKWNDKTFEWTNKMFIKDKVCTLFYMPLNFGAAMKRLDSNARKANASFPDWLCLSEHTSMWNMNVYLEVDKKVENAENVTMTGKFYCKVYEGKFSDTGKWMKDFNSVLQNKGLQSKKTLMWYTTCPKCAKKYGKNYVAIIAEI